MKNPENSNIKRIFKAIENANLKLLKKLLKIYPGDINDLRNKREQSLLFYSLSICPSPINNYLEKEIAAEEIVIYLIQETNINVKEQDKHGKTALIYSILINNAKIFLLLLEKGAEVNNPNQRQESPLGTSFFTKKTQDSFNFAEYLLDIGANINYKSSAGETALHILISFGSFDKIDLLLNHPKLEINTKNDDGQTGLSLLFNVIDEEDFVEITRGKIIEKFIQNGALFDLNLLETFLEKRKNFLQKHPNIDLQDYLGNTFLHVALENNRPDLAEKLLKLNANKYLKNNVGNLPLQRDFVLKNCNGKITEGIFPNRASPTPKNDSKINYEKIQI